MKIVIATDSFKGSLTSQEVGEAARAAIIEANPDFELVCIPLADGGEGTAQTLTDSLSGRWLECEVCDPLGRPIMTNYGIADTPEGMTAIIDTASASGLTLLTSTERNPMLTATYGTGQQIADAFRRGCRRFIIGLGGSATCDGGMGMLNALGVRFFDRSHKQLAPCGASLEKISEIDISQARREIFGCDFTLVCDVTNPLYGPQGAAYVFAPQKGANAREVEILDSGLRNFAKAIQSAIGKDLASIEGAGAAGGLCAAFLAFFKSHIESGADAVLDITGFDRAVEGASLVITGEGHIDEQTLYGKLPMGVLRRASTHGVPVAAIAGKVSDARLLHKAGFKMVIEATPEGMPLEEAMKKTAAFTNVKTAVEKVISSYLDLDPRLRK